MEDQRTFGEKVSDLISKFASSWKFIFSACFFIIIWICLQSIWGFDKYPYILLNLGLSLVAAFQAPFILMSQRRCEYKQDLIYLSLFKEIKEIMESNMEMEHEIKNEIKEIKTMLEEQ